MRRGCEIGDYIVAVGAVTLDNDALGDNQLIVRLLDQKYFTRGDDQTTCGDLYPVRVRTHSIHI